MLSSQHTQACHLICGCYTFIIGSIQVTASNVSWLLDMASYLEIPALLDACCAVSKQKCSSHQ
jgi:hypothetical protein